MTPHPKNMNPKESYECPVCLGCFNGPHEVMLDFEERDCAHGGDTEIDRETYEAHTNGL